MEEFRTYDELVNYLSTQGIVGRFMDYAKEKGITPPSTQLEQNHKMIAEILNANIIYDILGMLEHVKYVNLTDETVLKAVEVLENGEAFPEKEEEESIKL